MERRLYKSRKEKMIAGVAGGIAEYFDVDPVLVRIGFVVLGFLHGVGVLAYIILWIVMPTAKFDPVPVGASDTSGTFDTSVLDSDTAPAANPLSTKRSNNAAFIGGSLLIGLGVLFLLDNLFPVFDFGELWPLLLIILGGGLLWNSIKRDS
jgi:phage shock protein PspC (stress-responsive transcriptional regulator)